MLTPQKAIHYERYEFNKWEPFNAETIVEAPVSLTVNSEAWLTFMCTPVNLEAMAVGFLLNEEILEKMTEVADVRVCEHGDNVDVWLNARGPPTEIVAAHVRLFRRTDWSSSYLPIRISHSKAATLRFYLRKLATW